ncbi:G patch domain and ankyrin repeat-containing protein 1, partial [Blyttiomyces sp. JEL0837]
MDEHDIPHRPWRKFDEITGQRAIEFKRGVSSIANPAVAHVNNEAADEDDGMDSATFYRQVITTTTTTTRQKSTTPRSTLVKGKSGRISKRKENKDNKWNVTTTTTTTKTVESASTGPRHIQHEHDNNYASTLSTTTATSSEPSTYQTIPENEPTPPSRHYCPTCQTYLQPTESPTSHKHKIPHLLAESLTNKDTSTTQDPTRPKVTFGLNETHVGFRLLQREGWRYGYGLGPSEQGRTIPVPAKIKHDRLGLGVPKRRPKVGEVGVVGGSGGGSSGRFNGVDSSRGEEKG